MANTTETARGAEGELFSFHLVCGGRAGHVHLNADRLTQAQILNRNARAAWGKCPDCGAGLHAVPVVNQRFGDAAGGAAGVIIGFDNKEWKALVLRALKPLADAADAKDFGGDAGFITAISKISPDDAVLARGIIRALIK